MMAALLMGSSMGFSSCSLEEYNPSGEGGDAVFATPQGMENLVNNMYYIFRKKLYGREDPCLTIEGAADIWQNIGSQYNYGMQATRCVDLQAGQGQFQNAWAFMYENINDANAVIGRLPECRGLSASARTDFEGEARFMRSYCYWYLCEMFGDVELRTKETTTAEFSAVRTSRKTIYDEVIIPDARQAAEMLDVTPYKGNQGRPTKKAAKALLARVLLTRAQYEEAGSAEQKQFYEQARDAALDVINNKAALGIALYPTYDEIWQAKNNKNNTEYLWTVTFSSNQALNPDSKPNRLHAYFSPELIDKASIVNDLDYPSETKMLMPTYYFMNLWQDWDARYDADFQEEFKENKKFGSFTWTEAEANKYLMPELVGKKVKKGEVVFRFTRQHVSAEEEAAHNYATVDIDKLYETENVTPEGGARVRNFNENPTKSTQYIASSFPRFNKFRIWDGDANGTVLLLEGLASSKASFADVPVMRYAEMPLIAAECYIALGDQASAARIINSEIRTARVVKAGHSLAEAQVNPADMTIDWIMEERARELCGEWLRWFDVKRIYAPQGKFASTIRGRNPSMTKDDCIQEFHSLRPIPLNFLDKLNNPEEFGQNPGYNPYVRGGNK